MGDKPRWMPWALAGCGTITLGVGAVVVAGLLASSWCAPSTPETPPASSSTRAPSPFALDTEGFDSVEDIVRDRNARLIEEARPVYTGGLDPGSDAEIKCSPGLSVSVPAGTFTRPETLSVKALTLSDELVAAAPLAAYDVTIGKGGPLDRPVTLAFTHAPVPLKRPLSVGRWDEERAEWTAVPSTRESPTVSVAKTDHLSIFALFEDLQDIWKGGVADFDFDVYLQTRDGHFTIAIPAIADPDLTGLLQRVGERTRAQAIRRLEVVLDKGGFTDLSQPKPARYTARARRRCFAAILERMLSRIRRSYAESGYQPPPHVYIMASRASLNPQYLSRSLRPTIRIPWDGLDSAEELAVDLAHEMFHACQGSSGLGSVWMGRNAWLMEATAEFAGSRVAWADLEEAGFDEYGVVLRASRVRDNMGRGLSPAFILRPLASIPPADHAYRGAHFLGFLLQSPPKKFEDLWKQIHAAAWTDRNEVVLESFCRRSGASLAVTYDDFADHLVLDTAFGPPADRQQSDTRAAAIVLGAATPAWSQKLFIPGAFSGAYVGFRLDPADADPDVSRVLTLTFTSPGGKANVRVYQASTHRLDVATTVPYDQANVSIDGWVVTVPFTAREQVWVIASCGAAGGVELGLHAELGEGLAVSGKPRNDGTWRLEVQTPEPLRGRVRYRWQLKDPDGPLLVETLDATVDHAYSRPGPYEVRATLVDKDDERKKIAEATGVVTVTSALRLTILDARSRRPVPGARVRVHAGDWTSSGPADGAGVATAEPMPPLRSRVTVTVEADGYKTYSQTTTVDLTEELVVRKQIHLEPKGPPPRVAHRTPEATPPPTPRPPPPPRPEPTPTPRPAARPTAPPTPAPPPEPTYDDAAGLAAWKAAWEAGATGSDSSSACDSLARCQCRYTHEWTVAPYLEGGYVMGASTKLLDKTCEDGRVLQHYPVAVVGEAGRPVRLNTIEKIRKEYPQFWRR